MTKREVMKRLKGLDAAQAKSVACALIGHSLIVTACFGYIYCGRCGDQIADKLASTFSEAENCVQVGHGCKICRANYAKMDWKHKFLVANPFKKQKEAA